MTPGPQGRWLWGAVRGPAPGGRQAFLYFSQQGGGSQYPTLKKDASLEPQGQGEGAAGGGGGGESPKCKFRLLTLGFCSGGPRGRCVCWRKQAPGRPFLTWTHT